MILMCVWNHQSIRECLEEEKNQKNVSSTYLVSFNLLILCFLIVI